MGISEKVWIVKATITKKYPSILAPIFAFL